MPAAQAVSHAERPMPASVAQVKAPVMHPAVNRNPAPRPRCMEMPIMAMAVGPGAMATSVSAVHAKTMFGQLAPISVQMFDISA